jgi:hypothetical protein
VADTDDDGLLDGTELDGPTDATVADTDDDGLADGAEREAGTDPTVADTDRDRLDDGLEVELGTDPTHPDTDGDELADGVEAADTGPLADADPLRRDVFVELDYMAGERPRDRTLELVETAFADGPVENPDGSTGIDLHVVVDEEIPAESTTNVEDRDRLMDRHFDREDTGYRYAIAVRNASLDEDDVGGFSAIRGGNGQFVFETTNLYGPRVTPGTENVASVLMHELGHSLGIGSDTYRGVDSTEVPYDEYRSVLNYNARGDSLVFSDGEPFDDWAYIAEEMFTPTDRASELPTPDGDEDDG